MGRPSIVLWSMVTAALFSGAAAFGQSDGMLQIDDAAYRFLERQYVLGRLPGAHLEHQPLSYRDASALLDTLAADSTVAAMGRIDRVRLHRLRGTGTSPAVALAQSYVPFLYANGRDVVSVEGDRFALQANPLLYLSSGFAFRDGFATPSDSYPWWRSSRGLRFSGHIGRIFFETRLEENQRLPYRPEFYKFTAPRLGRVKWDVDGQTPYSEAAREPYDYFRATGVVGFGSPFFEVRFGRDRNLWGAGRSSLQLSNYAPEYDQLQIRTTVWRLQYVNLWAGLTDIRSIDAPPLSEGRAPEQVFPRRYAAFHRLSVNLTRRLQAHLFEAIVFADDTTGLRKGFDISYMNPVIFYRAAEADRGSPDNALVGAGVSWIVRPGLRLHTQFLFDEIRFRELTDPGDGWWGNKWGLLAGIELADPLSIPNTTLRVEHARNRPFMFSHLYVQNAYIHFADVLGHPAGPNAADWAVFLDMEPVTDWTIGLDLAMTRRGRNPEGVNLGADPLIPYNQNRPTDSQGNPLDYGYTMFAGTPQFVLFGEFRVAFQLLPGLFAEAAVHAEGVEDKDLGSDWYVIPTGTLRWGLPFEGTRY